MRGLLRHPVFMYIYRRYRNYLLHHISSFILIDKLFQDTIYVTRNLHRHNIWTSQIALRLGRSEQLHASKIRIFLSFFVRKTRSTGFMFSFVSGIWPWDGRWCHWFVIVPQLSFDWNARHSQGHNIVIQNTCTGYLKKRVPFVKSLYLYEYETDCPWNFYHIYSKI